MALTQALTFSGLFVLIIQTTANQDCATGFKVRPNSQSCYRAVLESKSWDDAQATCKASNANLASVTSQKELEFIWDHVVNETFYHYWIGLYKDETTALAGAARDNWQWIDGTTFNTSWIIWKAGQPKSVDRYTTLFVSFTGTDPHWNGESVAASRHVFICEHELTQTSNGSAEQSDSDTSTVSAMSTPTVMTGQSKSDSSSTVSVTSSPTLIAAVCIAKFLFETKHLYK